MGAFAAALLQARAEGRAAVIAEVKPRTAEGVDLLRGRAPGELAAAYTRGGATCLSVVTGKWFGGTPALLSTVAAQATLPILCKDFIRTPGDVRAARERGASAVLVTLKILPRLAAEAVLTACRAEGVDPFVEVSTVEELAQALTHEVQIIAINNRDIQARERTGEGIERSLRLLPETARADVAWVSASGIEDAPSVRRLAASGFDGLLVGTHLLLDEDPEGATRTLVEAAVRRPRATIKVCGVQTEAELDGLAALGVDMVGLAILPGEPYALSSAEAHRLAARCPAGVQAVLVTIERDPQKLIELVEEVQPRAVQLAGLTRPSQVAALRQRFSPSVLEIIQVLHLRGQRLVEHSMLEAYVQAGADRFILDAVSDGRLGSTGHAIDDAALDAFRASAPKLPFLLAGGLAPDNVRERLERSGAVGVDVFSGVRGASGIDLERARALVLAVRG